MPRHKYLTRDAEQELFDDVAVSGWSVGNNDSDSIDLGAADVDMKDPGVVVIKVSGLTSGGAAELQFVLLDSADDSTFAVLTPVEVNTKAALAYDDASWADVLYLPVPDFGIRRYLKLRAVVGTAVLTGGTCRAWYSKRAQ